MAPASQQRVRRAAVAGMFYPAGAEACRAQASEFLKTKELSGGRAIGAIVPHAGWMCSGAIAGEAIATLARFAGTVDLVVVFGAVHTPVRVNYAALDEHDCWESPLRLANVATELNQAAAASGSLFVADARLHEREHAVEVEVPLIQLAWPNAAVLPIETPAAEFATEVGETIAKLCEREKLNAVFLASSDLTHYGPAYQFTPAGVGEQGLSWAKDNDRRLLSLVTDMRAESIVQETKQQQNACGGGAIAAMLSACRYLGGRSAEILSHRNSYETLASVAPQDPVNAVGYASVVVTA